MKRARIASCVILLGVVAVAGASLGEAVQAADLGPSPACYTLPIRSGGDAFASDVIAGVRSPDAYSGLYYQKYGYAYAYPRDAYGSDATSDATDSTSDESSSGETSPAQWEPIDGTIPISEEETQEAEAQQNNDAPAETSKDTPDADDVPDDGGYDHEYNEDAQGDYDEYDYGQYDYDEEKYDDVDHNTDDVDPDTDDNAHDLDENAADVENDMDDNAHDIDNSTEDVKEGANDVDNNAHDVEDDGMNAGNTDDAAMANGQDDPWKLGYGYGYDEEEYEYKTNSAREGEIAGETDGLGSSDDGSELPSWHPARYDAMYGDAYGLDDPKDANGESYNGVETPESTDAQDTDEKVADGSRRMLSESDHAYLALTLRLPYGLSPFAVRQYLAFSAPASQAAEASAAEPSTSSAPVCPRSEATEDNRGGDHDGWVVWQTALKLSGVDSQPDMDAAFSSDNWSCEYAYTYPDEETGRKLREDKLREECKEAIRQGLGLETYCQSDPETERARPEKEADGLALRTDGNKNDPSGYQSVPAFAHFGGQLESGVKSNANPTNSGHEEYFFQPTADDASHGDATEEDVLSTGSGQIMTGRHIFKAAIGVAARSLDRMGQALCGLSHRLQAMP
ncbi:MAG: hypothetical protein JW818_18345 [Pirellulales bacterium]|nr:hypothetical protein [Pirellulales bacterium]